MKNPLHTNGPLITSDPLQADLGDLQLAYMSFEQRHMIYGMLEFVIDRVEHFQQVQLTTTVLRCRQLALWGNGK